MENKIHDILNALSEKPRWIAVVFCAVAGCVAAGLIILTSSSEKVPSPTDETTAFTDGPFITIVPPDGDANIGIGNPIQIRAEDETGMAGLQVLMADKVVWSPSVFPGQQVVVTTYPWIPERTGEYTFIVRAKTVDERQTEKSFKLTASCCPLEGEINIGYIVREGDNPAAIAAGFGVCFDTLLEKNPYLRDIAPGDVLNIPFHIGSEQPKLPDVDCGKAPINFFNNPSLFQDVPRRASSIPVAVENFNVERGFGCSDYFTGYYGIHCPTDAPWFHTGLDVSLAEGHPITSASSGAVSHAGPDNSSRADCSHIPGSQPPHNGYGRYVRVEKGDTSIIYAHLSVVTAEKGQIFDGWGYLLGFSGSSGCSSGPHLHLEVRKGSIAIDPLLYLQQLEEIRLQEERAAETDELSS